MRIYYCQCGVRTEVPRDEMKECDCGKVFGNGSNFKTSNHVNMRTTWSGQTKVEISQTTIDEDIKQRNAR